MREGKPKAVHEVKNMMHTECYLGDTEGGDDAGGERSVDARLKEFTRWYSEVHTIRCVRERIDKPRPREENRDVPDMRNVKAESEANRASAAGASLFINASSRPIQRVSAGAPRKRAKLAARHLANPRPAHGADAPHATRAKLATVTPTERTDHILRWNARTGSHIALVNFMTSALGQGVSHWWMTAQPAGLTPPLPDDTVAVFIDACIDITEREDITLDQLAYFVGHRSLSRHKPSFHNYTADQVRELIPHIARHWFEATDNELTDAMEHHRNDQLRAYFLSRNEGLPMEYALEVA